MFSFACNRFSYLETDEQLVDSFLYAARDGDVTTVVRMLRDGMPVDVSYRLTALHLATLENRTDVIKHLLHEGADVNRQGYNKNTPLHYAARGNNIKVVRMLIDNGADINLKDSRNKTPLDDADKGSEVERLLLQVQQSTP